MIHHALSQTVASSDPELSASVRVQVVADRQRFIAKHPDVMLQAHMLVGS
jgi:hypothetical protein